MDGRVYIHIHIHIYIYTHTHTTTTTRSGPQLIHIYIYGHGGRPEKGNLHVRSISITYFIYFIAEEAFLGLIDWLSDWLDGDRLLTSLLWSWMLVTIFLVSHFHLHTCTHVTPGSFLVPTPSMILIPPTPTSLIIRIVCACMHTLASLQRWRWHPNISNPFFIAL